MSNVDIRNKIRERRLRHYEVAEKIGISETTLCVWLRHELTDERKKRVLEAIEQLNECHANG